jgi:hypothetical protein
MTTGGTTLMNGGANPHTAEATRIPATIAGTEEAADPAATFESAAHTKSPCTNVDVCVIFYFFFIGKKFSKP